VDADDNGGVVIQYNVTAGSPHVFTASRDTYVDLAEDGTATYTAVANGAPEPAVAASSVRVWKVVTDGTEITSANTVLPEIPVFKDIAANSLALTDLLAVGGDLDVTGNLTVGGDSALGDDAGDSHTVTGTLDVTGDTTITGVVDITGDTSVTGALDVSEDVTAASSTGNAVVGTSSNNTASGVRGVNSAGGWGVTGVSTTGVGVAGVGGGSGAGVTGTGGATGAGVAGTGGATSGHGVTGTATAGASSGVLGTGCNNSSSHGVNGVATNTSAYGVRGTSAAAATTSAAGVRAEGLGDAPALSAVAVNGNAARLESDTSTPTRAPLVIVPQDADASTTQVGSLAVNSSRLNKIRHHDGSDYLSIHSSAKGYLKAVSTTSSGNNAASSGDILPVTITPEQTGTVIVEVTGFWNGRTDTTEMTILLKDVTEPSTFATSQPLNSLDIDGVGITDRMLPFTYRMPYTLPSAATREFRVRLDFSATVDWYDVFLTVEGVF
jgi:hypothetical protein